ncbi:MFS transporter [Streptococcus tangpeifui]|uniref:MFS transporter n=1 Tax=Streptococcus tangpeifui TaxID=2709400 RepID=UPI0013EB6B5A|nr:MFS transporter [Streptococcus sp. ZJ1593]
MKQKRIWIVVGLVMLGIVMRSPFTTIPTILSNIAKSLEVPVSSLGALTSIPLLMFAFFSSLAPKLAQRFGLERLMAVILFLMAIGSALRIIALPTLYLGTVVVGATIACVNVLLPSIVARYFPHKVGIYTTLYTSVMGLSSTIFTSLASPITHIIRWRGFILCLSAIVLLAFILWLPNVSKNAQVQMETKTAEPSQQNLWTNKYALALLIFGGLQSLLFYTEMTWLPTLSQAAGFSASQAGSLLGLYNLVSLPMSLTIPNLVTSQKRQQRTWTMLGFAGLTFLGIAILLSAPKTYFFWALGHVSLGLSVAALFPYMLVSFNLKTTTAQNTARLSGMVQTGGYLLAAIGPFLLGYSQELFGSWEALLWILALMAGIMGLSLVAFEKTDSIL